MSTIARSKFNVDKDLKKRTYNGIIFDSVLEMNYYIDVVLPLYKSGEIVRYEMQKKYELQPPFKHHNSSIRPINYVADFFIVYKDGHEEVIDTKGCPDSVALMKRKMFWFHYPNIIYRWIGYSKIDGGWCDYEYIKQQRAKRKKERKKKECTQKKSTTT